jgi:hypothetical protein
VNKIRQYVLLLSALTLSACASGTRGAGSRPAPSQPSNAVAFSGPSLGSGELFTNKCISGGQFAFRGADVADGNTKEILVLRLVIDPLQGPAVRLFKDSETGPSLILKPADCTTFKYEFGSTGRSVNFVTEVKVSLQLDCRTKKGDAVVGNVDLPACL